jgi:aminopeptidase N
VAGDGRREHLRASFATDGEVFTSFSVLQEAPEQWPTLRSHRVAVGLYELVDGRLVRTHREELDVVGAKTEVPGLVGRRQPTWCWSTTTTSPTPRSGWTSGRSRR